MKSSLIAILASAGLLTASATFAADVQSGYTSKVYDHLINRSSLNASPNCQATDIIINNATDITHETISVSDPTGTAYVAYLNSKWIHNNAPTYTPVTINFANGQSWSNTVCPCAKVTVNNDPNIVGKYLVNTACVN